MNVKGGIVSESYYMSERQPYPQRFIGARRFIAATALGMSVVSCHSQSPDVATPAPESHYPAFNHPEAAPYFIDADDKYYEQIESVRSLSSESQVQRNIDWLAETPVAVWLNGDIQETKQTIRRVLDKSAQRGEVPVFIAYNIPDRDLGSEAAGGLSSPEKYQEWVTMMSEEIGDKASVIVLEPDALADVPNMDSEDSRSERIGLLRGALETFQGNNKRTAVYLDAGNSAWLSSHDVAELIKKIDPESRLVGAIALNVASYRSPARTEAY